MKTYGSAIAVGMAGIAATAVTALSGGQTSGLMMPLACTAGPLSVLLLVRGRLDRPKRPLRAFVGGATVGPVVAIASHAFVAAFAAAFFLGFLEAGRRLLSEVFVNPKLVTLLTSPWLILLLVELVVVAPVTEEAGKFLGSRFAHPATRREAFLSGVAAGAGFAIVENLLYASLAVTFGGPWTVVLVARTMGVAVHPLATGLVALGWWDHRHGVSRAAIRGFSSGVGVHALWNGTLVVLAIAATTSTFPGMSSGPESAELAFAAALGVLMAAGLWITTSNVATGARPRPAVMPARTAAAWIILASSLLVPVAALTIASPVFFRG